MKEVTPTDDKRQVDHYTSILGIPALASFCFSADILLSVYKILNSLYRVQLLSWSCYLDYTSSGTGSKDGWRTDMFYQELRVWEGEKWPRLQSHFHFRCKRELVLSWSFRIKGREWGLCYKFVPRKLCLAPILFIYTHFFPQWGPNAAYSVALPFSLSLCNNSPARLRGSDCSMATQQAFMADQGFEPASPQP